MQNKIEQRLQAGRVGSAGPREVTLKDVIVAYPSGNTTAVVSGQPPKADLKILNARILQTWKSQNPGRPQIEQCCYITAPHDPAAAVRVEMFGGEFCGNAARSAAWIISRGRDATGLIEASGVDRPLKFAVRVGLVSLEMPLPESRSLIRPVAEGTLVQLQGITQLVVRAGGPVSALSARQMLGLLLKENRYGLRGQPAVGVSRFDAMSRKAEFCVWVKGVSTVFDESACGSGTCAIGIAAALDSGRSAARDVIQPSGELISTEAVVDPQSGNVTDSIITGRVGILFDGGLELI